MYLRKVVKFIIELKFKVAKENPFLFSNHSKTSNHNIIEYHYVLHIIFEKEMSHFFVS